MSVSTNSPAAQNRAVELDRFKVDNWLLQAKGEQNLPLGLIAGFFAAVLAAIVWAGITVLANYQIGWMAIGVGYLVGIAVRQFGKGIAKSFGIMGAALAFLGCLLGNLLSFAIIISQQKAVSFVAVVLTFLTNPLLLLDIFRVAFSPIDLLFYGLALYEGYKFSFRQISAAELQSLKKIG